MSLVEVRLHDDDRARLGGPEWQTLDVDRLLDTPYQTLVRWETECGYSIERALAECAVPFPPAKAVCVLVWLTRKQAPGRPYVDQDGMPESFAHLKDIRTMQVRIRDKAPELEPEASDDADPPVPDPAPISSSP